MDLNEDDDQLRIHGDEVDDEDEDEEMEGDDGEFINLVDVLDGETDADTGNDGSTTSKHSLTKATKSTRESVAEVEDVDEESEGVEEESSSAEEAKLDFTPSDDEAAPEALDELENFITSLETSDKKRKDHPDSKASTSQEPKRKKRQTIRERTEAGTENEFRAQASGTFLTAIIHVLLTIIFQKAQSFSSKICLPHLRLSHPPSKNSKNQPKPFPRRPLNMPRLSLPHCLNAVKNVLTEKQHTNKRRKKLTNGEIL